MTKEFEQQANVPTLIGRAISIEGGVEEHGCWKADDLWLFDSWRQQRYPPSVYPALVSSASRKVWVWDRYLNEGDIDAFQTIQSGVSFRLLFLGSCHSQAHKVTAANFITAFSERFPAVTLQVKCLDSDRYRDKALGFHDRYLFVDEDVFSVGSSMSSHRKREWSTAVMKVMGPAACKLLHDKFEAYWENELTTWVRQP